MTLGEIIEKDHNCGGQHLGRCRKPAEIFYKDLQADIVDDHAAHDHNKITEELHSSFQVGTLEGYIHAQVKTNRESDDK